MTHNRSTPATPGDPGATPRAVAVAASPLRQMLTLPSFSGARVLAVKRPAGHVGPLRQGPQATREPACRGEGLLGTRRSALATTQSGWVADRLRELGATVELVEITTEGDTNRAPLTSIGGTGVFASALREALLAGRGIAPAHRWLVDDLLADGRLLAVLPNHALPAVPLSLLIVPERAGIARVRLLADFLAEAVGGIPGIER